MRLLICAGGTGGGVYPALTVLQAVRDRAEVLWVGGEGGMEAALVRRAGVPFQSIPAGGVHGVGAAHLPGNLWRLLRGYFAARRILRVFNPHVIFYTGGYLAVPMAAAAWRYPTLLYVPDIEPGLALKTISNIANSIALTTDESCRFFRHGKRLVTGYPVRPELAHWDRQKGRQRLGLEQEGPALLVSGGSRGARALNQAVMDNLPALLELAQVVHISGDLDWPTIEGVRDRLSKAQASRYLAYPYLHEEMGAALASADLVVSRAGASVLGEYPLFGLPAILVPYPYAWRYQKVNADYLVERGAAVLLENERLADGLLPTVRNLLTGTTQRQSMRQAMQGLAQPHAAARIAEELVALAGRR